MVSHGRPGTAPSGEREGSPGGRRSRVLVWRAPAPRAGGDSVSFSAVPPGLRARGSGRLRSAGTARGPRAPWPRRPAARPRPGPSGHVPLGRTLGQAHVHFVPTVAAQESSRTGSARGRRTQAARRPPRPLPRTRCASPVNKQARILKRGQCALARGAQRQDQRKVPGERPPAELGPACVTGKEEGLTFESPVTSRTDFPGGRTRKTGLATPAGVLFIAVTSQGPLIRFY